MNSGRTKLCLQNKTYTWVGTNLQIFFWGTMSFPGPHGKVLNCILQTIVNFQGEQESNQEHDAKSSLKAVITLEFHSPFGWSICCVMKESCQLHGMLFCGGYPRIWLDSGKNFKEASAVSLRRLPILYRQEYSCKDNVTVWIALGLWSAWHFPSCSREGKKHMVIETMVRSLHAPRTATIIITGKKNTRSLASYAHHILNRDYPSCGNPLVSRCWTYPRDHGNRR